jgi:fatty-acyl-CoA synthase
MNLPLTPLRFLERAKSLYGNKEGVICGAEQFTYAAFFERCCRLAGALRGLGLQSGDRVAFLSYNCHRLLEGYYGVLLAGGVLLPINIRLSPAEIVFILKDAGAKILFFDADFLPFAAALRGQLPDGVQAILLEPHESAPPALNARSYEQLLVDASPVPFDFMQVPDDSLAELFYTSGSTGEPKGVMLTHRTVYLHAVNTLLTQHLTDRTVHLQTIPLFHANGWGTAHTITAVGGTHVMLKKFEPERICQLIEQERVTCFSMVPTMANALVHCPALARHNRSSVEWVMIGGAASSPQLIRQLEEKIGCRAYAGYGLTETSPVLSIAYLTETLEQAAPEEKWRRQAMTGRAIVGVELRVVDEAGKDVARDGATMGEVIARGDGVMDGYWKQSGEAARSVEGWLRTGDMAVWDEEGFLLIVDRKKEIIVSGGENISSLEVERALCAHPSVYECAVIAVPDDTWGEVPKALVVLKENSTTPQEELIAFLRNRLAKFKIPKSVEFLPSLPKGGTGKILKKDLREKYWAGYEKRVH